MLRFCDVLIVLLLLCSACCSASADACEAMEDKLCPNMRGKEDLCKECVKTNLEALQTAGCFPPGGDKPFSKAFCKKVSGL